MPAGTVHCITTAPVAPAPALPLDLEARLAAVDAAMTVRLQVAGLAVDVNTAHLSHEPVDWADVVRGPVDHPPPAPAPLPTPVADLISRARHRMLVGGWCATGYRDEAGAMCLAGAVRAEAGGDRRMEMAALDLILTTIRTELDPAAETVPSWNDAQPSARMPLRILDHATTTAATRGI